MLSLQHECYLGFLEISAERGKTVAESRIIIYPKKKKNYVEFSCDYYTILKFYYIQLILKPRSFY